MGRYFVEKLNKCWNVLKQKSTYDLQIKSDRNKKHTPK